jgi:hypothetical protein
MSSKSVEGVLDSVSDIIGFRSRLGRTHKTACSLWQLS